VTPLPPFAFPEGEKSWMNRPPPPPDGGGDDTLDCRELIRCRAVGGEDGSWSSDEDSDDDSA
jgi:hypothetical protein